MEQKKLDRLDILELTYQGKYEDASTALETFESQKDPSSKDQIVSKILQSRIKIAKGKYEEALRISEYLLNENVQHTQSIEIVDLYIVKSTALEHLNEFDESLNTIIQAENILTSLYEEIPQDLTRREAELLFLKGRVFYLNPTWGLEKMDQGLSLLEKSLADFEQLNDHHGIALCLRNIGMILGVKKEAESALKYVKRSLAIAEEFDYKLIIAECNYSIGHVSYGKEEDLNQILDHLNKALILFEELNHNQWIYHVLIFIGKMYLEKGELSRANDSIQRAARIVEESGRKIEIGKALNEISIYYLSAGELDQAVKYGLKSLTVFENIEDKFWVANVKDTIGWIYFMIGELDLAEDYLQQSMSEFNNLDESWGRIYPPSHLADVYQAKGDYDQAIKYAQQALALCEEGEYFSEASYVLSRLISLNLDTQRIEEAKSYFQRLNSLVTSKIQTKYGRQLCRLTEGIILKQSPRLRDKMKAQELFESIVKEPVYFFPTSFDAAINLCELLLIELSVSGDEKVFQEAKTLVQELVALARQNKSFTSEIHALIIQTKFVMVEGDLSTALEFLEQAEAITMEKNLKQLAHRVSEEKQQVENQFKEWETLIQSNAPFQARLKQAHFDEYLIDALKIVKSQKSTTS